VAITRAEHESAKKRATEYLQRAGIPVSANELDTIETADLGLGELELSGVQIATLVDTDEVAAKVLVLFPGQTEPEHWHPPLGEYPGKHETIRCHWGELYLYEPGEAPDEPKGHPPAHRAHTYTDWHEHVLRPGDQVTLPPNTPHWFQGGPEGAVVWSFSTKAIDIQDGFRDPDVRRETVIID
jgi:D-lyxose ketol-isomerase